MTRRPWSAKNTGNRANGSIRDGRASGSAISEDFGVVSVVVIGALPPGGLVQARHLAKRLRASVPGIKIVVGRWCMREDVDGLREVLSAAGADTVSTSLLEARDVVVQFARTAAVPERAA